LVTRVHRAQIADELEAAPAWQICCEQDQVGLVLGGQPQQLVTIRQEDAVVSFLLELMTKHGPPLFFRFHDEDAAGSLREGRSRGKSE
jgi:hypothetical protein